MRRQVSYRYKKDGNDHHKQGNRTAISNGCSKLQIVFVDKVRPGGFKFLSFRFTDFRVLEV